MEGPGVDSGCCSASAVGAVILSLVVVAGTRGGAGTESGAGTGGGAETRAGTRTGANPGARAGGAVSSHSWKTSMVIVSPLRFLNQMMLFHLVSVQFIVLFYLNCLIKS